MRSLKVWVAKFKVDSLWRALTLFTLRPRLVSLRTHYIATKSSKEVTIFVGSIPQGSNIAAAERFIHTALRPDEIAPVISNELLKPDINYLQQPLFFELKNHKRLGWV